ncbi:MAG: Asp-tRNA(Asn)/Glu-tRNA(Gln) amidotransferase subunit GatC, partial [Acetobacteraceae bacterium]|nr:Asp-tRNA(Asn)/Glu-tRNA(Gln) amidotransferase subunit GatC [Acetobacteraceae bacterium]
EVEVLRGELNGILGWIEQLNEVNVDGIEPLASGVTMAARLRDDTVNDGSYKDRILANAPDRTEDYFAVPKVVE